MPHEPLRPSLDAIRIPTACPKRWDELEGGGSRRWCEACRFHVMDLSALTRSEAEAFLAESAGRTCVSYLRRGDGSVVTRPERAPLLHSTLTAWTRAAAGFVALLALLPGCRRASATPDASLAPVGPADHCTLGRIAAPDVPERLVGKVCLPEPVRIPDQSAAPSPEPIPAPGAEQDRATGLEQPQR
jgi:hypothetical protein